ncbi:ABC transporter permease [Candidatus Microgenomates bacterium]|nr:ABC transporter permease [Candidatus Microgenomates bacterium]
MTGPKTSFMHMLKNSFADFKRNKVRTFLTSLGIMVGVMSVVLLIALGLGLKNYLEEQFESLGANLIMIMPGSGFGGGGGGFSGPAGLIGGAEFDERDLESLKRIREIEYVVPLYLESALIESDDTEFFGYIEGINEEGFVLMNLEPLEGEVFDKGDVSSQAKVVVLGNKVAEELFGNPEDGVRKTIRMKNQRFKVIGVLEKKGDPEMDSSAFIPYKTTYGSMNPDKTFFSIYLGVKNDDDVAGVKQEAEETLLKRYDEDSFSVIEQSELLETVNQIFSVLNGVLLAIGSISLFVGGIGIMNIMYATVTERTKEIGIRRAIGATQKDILLQFLSESLILSVLGGLAGLLSATGIVLIIRIFFPASINLVAVLVSFFVSSAIGIIFGVFPAKRASKLSPIEAIRYE